MATATMNTNSPADILRWQQEQITGQQFEEVGRIWMIVFEAAKGAAVPAVANTLGSRMEFYGYGRQGRNLMPRIAKARDGQTLLILDPFLNPEGAAGLPDIPDPNWTPPIPKASQVAGTPGKNGRIPKGQGSYTPPKPRMLPQKFAERARGQLKGSRYLVFGPVVQIVIRLDTAQQALIAQCGGDVSDGRQMELLVDQDNGRAFLFGGRYQLVSAG